MASPISVFSIMVLYSVDTMVTRYGMEVWGVRALMKTKYFPPPPPGRPWAIQPPANWKIVLFPESKAAGTWLSQPTPV
jgi:hypothetical protein